MKSLVSRAKAAFFEVPEAGRFAISGGVGNFIFFFLDGLLMSLNPIEWNKATVTWTVSYLISIVIQFVLHRALVFGASKPFMSGLAATYASYSTGIVLSIVVNAFLTQWLYIAHFSAWLATLLITGVLNYFVVGAALRSEPVHAHP